ncbi:hypothetical protein ON010_g3094 [Phytophthora cinnamomi]|nr:hypothetical protein ON010_g3094 [Phytophthora cinnamomi]
MYSSSRSKTSRADYLSGANANLQTQPALVAEEEAERGAAGNAQEQAEDHDGTTGLAVLRVQETRAHAHGHRRQEAVRETDEQVEHDVVGDGAHVVVAEGVERGAGNAHEQQRDEGQTHDGQAEAPLAVEQLVHGGAGEDTAEEVAVVVAAHDAGRAVPVGRHRPKPGKTESDTKKTRNCVTAGIQQIDGIHLLGDPKAMVVSFAGDKGVNALKVSDVMAKHGWSLSPLQHPTSVHLCVTVRHIGKAKKFLSALEEAVNEVKQDPNPSPEGGSAIYGMASSLPAGPVDDLLRIYTDITLKV